MQMVDINLLKEHPRNGEFFDDIEGERWQEFVESIKTSGIIVPLIVTQDYIVISGNQRLKAAKEIGLKEVPCEIKTYEDRNGLTKEDWMLKDLIETNLRQRGIGNLNPMKLARCVIELERIYGIKVGKPQNQLQIMDNNSALSAKLQTSISQKDLAEIMGLKERRLRELKKLNDLIPELQKLVEEGKLTTKVGEQLAYFEPQEQKELYQQFGEALTELSRNEIMELRKNIEEMRNKIYELEKQKQNLEQQKIHLEERLNNIEPKTAVPDDYEEMKQALKEAEHKIEELQNHINYLEEQKKALLNQPPQIIEKVIEPPDYVNLKEKAERYKKQYEKLYNEYKSKEQELEAFKHHIENLHGANPVELLDIVDFKYTVNKFLKEVTPLVYLGDHFMKLSRTEKEKWLEQVETVQRWVDDVRQAIEGNIKGTNVIYLERRDK
ncbi:putative transcriptional regulator [Thermoanaerobacter sp. YS13]|uniref:ParB/RepB/Spo0J family partition protein n=1 Tax=Thermoanaerobacter sp. YS13 TaxID=1511746 RepID=UPI000573428B|nr:ParB/RepB/Spo0J family partition protein [Thermoanaerobacter sp. YS13]KHO63233.1 putative transcriptional regulator [Thermoanaerobacter sp. YS13]